ncbi:hypothetical protein ACFX5Q_34700 [Mesorhizobium sp. IMUNJ 23033]
MSETPKDKDQEKGDEVLRRLLKTPPKPHESAKPTAKPVPQPKKNDKKH